MLTASALRRETIDVEVLGLFTPATAVGPGPGRIGVELEWIPAVRGSGRPIALPAAATERLLARDPGLASDAVVTFEPGGQLEISPPPAPTVAELLASLASLRTRVERCLRTASAELYVSGLNPWHATDELGLQTPQPRYLAMQRHFDAISPYGRRMMRQSLALQVSLDLGDSAVATGRWRLANLLGPVLAAAFANSPIVAGEEVGIPGARSQSWQLLDPTRTGFDGAQVADPPAPAYAAFALGAAYIDLGGAADVRHHLSTLFPPVRPRRHIEVRFIDAQPSRWTPVPIVLLACLLYDRAATSEGLDLLAATRLDAATWRRSCEVGMADAGLREQAAGLFEIGRRALRRFTSGYFPTGAEGLLADYQDRYVSAGRCPADEQLDGFRQNPEDLSPWK